MTSKPEFIKEKLYLLLTSLFVVSLVTSNLVFQKFIDFKFPLIDHVFQISVGLLFFPITFVIADIVSEIYGKKKAEYMVLMGLMSGVFVMGIMWIASNMEAAGWSSVSDQEFNLMFGNYTYAMLASIIASFVAQILDVRIFISLKLFTNSKHLWLRNNVSTIIAQFVDTFLVILVMHLCGAFPVDDFWLIFGNSFYFKVILAILDTPIVYLFVWGIRKDSVHRIKDF